MNVWLMHIGEDLPIDGTVRRFRYGHLSAALIRAGHSVLRWLPTFCHTKKVQRFDNDHLIEEEPNLRMQFVHAPGYRRNVGFDRLRTYRVLAERFHEIAPTHNQPDIIVAAIPSLDWAEAAIRYGERAGTPVVIDVRDVWPDVYLQAVPKWLTPIGRGLLRSQFRQSKDICRRATALTGVSQAYVDWALANAGRQATQRDGVFPIGYEYPDGNAKVAPEALQRVLAKGVDPNKTICLFAGLFERSYDLESVVDAARLLNERHPGLQFVLCGDGGKAKSLCARAAGLDNVVWTGWLDRDELAAAMQLAAIGLVTYSPRASQSLPNKPFEYMAWSLANVSSLDGELKTLLESRECGVTYRAGDARALANAIGGLVEDRSRLAKLQGNALVLWQQEYRSQVICDEFTSYLRQLSEEYSLKQMAA